MLIPDHVLIQRHQAICQEKVETPEISEDVTSNSHNMSDMSSFLEFNNKQMRETLVEEDELAKHKVRPNQLQCTEKNL